MDIIVNVVNQKLRIATNLRNCVSGSQQFVRFIFNLPDEWIGLSPFAQFIQNGEGYNVYLDSDNSCYLPSEISGGECLLLLYGSNGTVIATTDAVVLTLDENALISDAQSTDISQSLYDQMMERISSITNGAMSLSNSDIDAIAK